MFSSVGPFSPNVVGSGTRIVLISSLLGKDFPISWSVSWLARSHGEEGNERPGCLPMLCQGKLPLLDGQIQFLFAVSLNCYCILTCPEISWWLSYK